MTTTVAPDLKPDHTESEQWPTLGRDPTHASDPYDDPTAPTTTRVRSGIAPLVVVLALGLAVLALMLSIPTSDSSPRHASGASTTPHIAR